MNCFKITFENGYSEVTNMNASLEEAKAYFIGTAFQFGDIEEIPYDLMIKAIAVVEVA